MIISLATPSTLRITRPGAAYAFLSALPGSEYQKATQSLLVRLCNLRRILNAFPTAQVVDRDAVIAARVELWARWVEGMNGLGVWFGYLPDARTVSCTGAHVSPCLREWVEAHSPQIEPHLHRQWFPAQMTRVAEAVNVEPSHADKLIWAGIQNAAKAEERRAETVGRVRARRFKKALVREQE